MNDTRQRSDAAVTYWPPKGQLGAYAQIRATEIGQLTGQFLNAPDPLDLTVELAAARALFMVSARDYCEARGKAEQALAEGKQPALTPDVDISRKALETIAKIAKIMHAMRTLDAVTAGELALLVRAILDVVARHVAPETLGLIRAEVSALKMPE